MAERSGLSRASAAASDAASIATSSVEKRPKLFPYDSVPSQLFESFGPGMTSDVNLAQLWKGFGAGNKKAQFHTALAASQDDDAWRVGSGLSLTAQSLLAAIDELRDDEMKALIKDEPCKRVIAEADALVPYLRVLDMGKGGFRCCRRSVVDRSNAAVAGEAVPPMAEQGGLLVAAPLELAGREGNVLWGPRERAGRSRLHPPQASKRSRLHRGGPRPLEDDWLNRRGCPGSSLQRPLRRASSTRRVRRDVLQRT